MSYFTNDDTRPSEKTLDIIRQAAYTYRVMKYEGVSGFYCLNCHHVHTTSGRTCRPRIILTVCL